jgi:hypothetical protein
VVVALDQRDLLAHKDFQAIPDQRDLQAQVRADYPTKQATVENY